MKNRAARGIPSPLRRSQTSQYFELYGQQRCVVNSGDSRCIGGTTTATPPPAYSKIAPHGSHNAHP